LPTSACEVNALAFVSARDPNGELDIEWSLFGFNDVGLSVIFFALSASTFFPVFNTDVSTRPLLIILWSAADFWNDVPNGAKTV